jgi:hypothetical protein
MNIILFTFIRVSTGDRLSFDTPNAAIDHFQSKGYGMWNWTIKVTFDDRYKSEVEIPLLMFNYITDHWGKLN